MGDNVTGRHKHSDRKYNLKKKKNSQGILAIVACYGELTGDPGNIGLVKFFCFFTD